MADCNDLFRAFDNCISLTPTDRKLLRKARTAITKKIKKYFNEHTQCPVVEFNVQGSFTMGTIIRPLNGEYDIDIGVYLRGYSNWRDRWPETVSQWLVNALYTHTSTPPVNKRNCVRIIYKPVLPNGDISYHVDLPIYCEYTNLLEECYTRIGITGSMQWEQKSDPIGFTNWFNTRCKQNDVDKNQLIRLVKYIKAWKEYQKGNMKFPSGMALTIVMANNYCPDSKDDVAFCKTVTKAYESVFSGFWASLWEEYEILSPVQPFNNVIERLNNSQIKKFKSCLANLATESMAAIREPSQEIATEIWQRLMGERI